MREMNSITLNGKKYDSFTDAKVREAVGDLNGLETTAKSNVVKAINEIKSEVDRVKSECVKTLNLLKDIEFNVEKVDSRCVQINISKLIFDGIITEIDIYYSIEVQ